MDDYDIRSAGPGLGDKTILASQEPRLSGAPAADGTSYWVCRGEDEVRLLKRAPSIRKLYLEPTSGCNLSCRTCVRNVWPESASSMSADTFQRIVASLDGLPELKQVVFAGFGEPTTHPDLLAMVEAVRARGLSTSISTNGLLLDCNYCRELVALGVDRLVVSVDGALPGTYADVRGTPLQLVVDNLRVLGEEKRRRGSPRPALNLEFVAMRSNVHELPAVAALAAELNATKLIVTNVLAYSEELRDQMLYGYEPRAPFPPASWPTRVDQFVTWGVAEMPRMYWGAERRCRFVDEQAAVVGADGMVSPCLALSHSYGYFALDGQRKQVARYTLGALDQESLAAIWMGRDFVRFRSEVRSFHFPSCPNCDIRTTCDLRENNEACWGWNPSCADCLWAQDIVRCP